LDKDVALQIEDMFADPAILPMVEVPGSADAYKARIRSALAGHVEHVATRRENPFGYRSKPCDTFGLAGKPPDRKAPAKVDLNPWAQRWFKARGWRFTRADRYDHALRRSFDFMGIFDYVCGDGKRTIGVQVTTWEHASDHRKKIRESKGFEKAKEMRWEALLLLAKRNERGQFDAVLEWFGDETESTSWAWENRPGMGQ